MEKYIDLTEQQGGGSGGTTNYNELSNQPQINGVTLTGNKTSSDLSLLSTDASNLTSTGQKVFDGQWVFFDPIVTLANTTLPTTKSTFNISSHLPVDNYKYEILVYVTTWGKVTNGAKITLQGRTDIMPAYITFARTVGQGTSTDATSINTFNLVVGKTRNIIVDDVINPPTGAGYILALLGYRRIGTNS